MIAAGLLGFSLGGALIGGVDSIVSWVTVLVIIGISNSRLPHRRWRVCGDSACTGPVA